MYKGYELALKRNNPVSFKFKGVETTLFPDQMAVDDRMVEIRIRDVMKELRHVSKVRKYIFLTNKKRFSVFFF